MTSTVLTRFGSSLNSSVALKAPVRCGTTGPIVLSGIQTIDGVVVSSTDQQNGLNIRCLVKNQLDQTTNGIYDMGTGAWVRSADFDGNEDIVEGTQVYVANGATQVGTWLLTTPDPAQIVATFPSNITFSLVSGLSNIPVLPTSAEIDPSNDYFPFYDSEAAATEKVNFATVARNFADGIAAAPGMAFAADQGTGLYRPGASQLGVTLGGALRALFTATALTLGVTGASLGALALSGSGSGVVTIQPQAAAGTWNFNLPITAGSAGQFLTSAGGGSSAMTWDNISAHLSAGTGISLSGTTIVTITSTVSVPSSANPSASVGLSAVNGSAATFMTSDSAPALSQSIAPTWTGQHIFNNAITQLGSSSQLQWSTDLILTRAAAATLQFGAADAAAPVAQTLLVQSVVAGTSNTAGAKFVIAGSKSTGNANGGGISLQTSPAGGSGSSQNSLVDRLLLDVDAYDQLALRDGTNPQQFVIYNTFTNTSNYERLSFQWFSNKMFIAMQEAGSGSARNVQLQAGARLELAANAGNDVWFIETSGTLDPSSDNAYDIGISGTNRVRNIYAAGTAEIGALRIDANPTAVSGAGPIAIGSGSTINNRMSISLNGTTYWFPCSTTAF